jgi:hypothetical protein
MPIKPITARFSKPRSSTKKALGNFHLLDCSGTLVDIKRTRHADTCPVLELIQDDLSTYPWTPLEPKQQHPSYETH